MGQDRKQTEFHGASEPEGEHRVNRRAASLLERLAGDSDSSRRHMSGANTRADAGLGAHFVGGHSEIRPEPRFQTDGADGSGVQAAVDSSSANLNAGPGHAPGQLCPERL